MNNCLAQFVFTNCINDCFGVNINDLKLIPSYIKGWQQDVKINNIQSILLHKVFVVPLGSIVEPILFNISVNDLLILLKMLLLGLETFQK